MVRFGTAIRYRSQSVSQSVSQRAPLDNASAAAKKPEDAGPVAGRVLDTDGVDSLVHKGGD